MKNIKVRSNNNILRITLDRAQQRNSINRFMVDSLISVFSEVKNSRKHDVVIIDSEGDDFSAGIDFYCVEKNQLNANANSSLKDLRKTKDLIHLIDSIPQPLIALTKGRAYGFSIGILSCCDFVFCHSSSKFCFHEVKLGLIPSIISIYVNRRIGYSRSLELILSGDVLGAEQAVECGLAYKVVDDFGYVDSFVENLCKQDHFTIRKVKSLLKNTYTKNISEKMLDFAIDEIVVSRSQPKTIELISNFLKRKKV